MGLIGGHESMSGNIVFISRSPKGEELEMWMRETQLIY